MRGTVKEAISILGIFVGLLVSSIGYGKISQFLFGWIDNPQMRQLFGFLLFFGLIVLAFSFLGLIISYVFKIRVKGVSSRVLGAGLGTLKGILFVSFLCVPLVTFLPGIYAGIKDSTLFSLETALSKKMVGLLPENIQNAYNRHIGDNSTVWETHSTTKH